MQTKTEYRWPIDKNKVTRTSTTESKAHKVYPHSVDFFAPIGTPIRAAADGIVIDVKDDSDVCGPTRDYEDYENFVEIRHGDEYSYYGHIKKGSAKFKVGDQVKAG